MAEKIKMTAPKGGGVEVVGLDRIFANCVQMENLICKYERFAEDVTLSCMMPEVPRYMMEDEELDGTMIPGALDAMQRLLVRYRRMVSWMRRNGIDVESVADGSSGDGIMS